MTAVATLVLRHKLRGVKLFLGQICFMNKLGYQTIVTGPWRPKKLYAAKRLPEDCTTYAEYSLAGLRRATLNALGNASSIIPGDRSHRDRSKVSATDQ